jgi:tetratricopeptide (TPR) repeat protein
MPPRYDVFLSYSRRDVDAVAALAAALEEAGVAVFLDRTGVETFSPIHDRVAEGIGGSRALLAWYSRDYAASRPCQWELSAAWLCDNGARVLVVNTEAGNDHIEPRSLLDRQYASSGDRAALVRVVKEAVAGFATAIGERVAFAQPLHYGRQLAGSNRFVGRAPVLWQLHDALSQSAKTMLSGTVRSVVQLRGLGGVGKSLLAEEYALRFGAAYPGGIFWLKAFGNDDSQGAPQPRDGDAERARQIAEFAAAFRIPVAGRPPPEIRAALAQALAAGPRSLWIVDDLPSGLAEDALSQWLSPAPAMPTLITTRDRAHSSMGVLVDLDVLSAQEALALFEKHRAIGDAEREPVAQLLEALGHHALAVEVAASYLADHPSEPIAGFLAGLRDPGEDVLEDAAELADALPIGHSPSIVATLSGTIGGLGEPARDLLCLAACVAVAPIPKELLDGVFTRLSGAATVKATRMKAAKEAERLSLVRREPTPADALSVHTLVARSAWRHPANRVRREAIRNAAVETATDLLLAMISPGTVLRQNLLVAHARALCARLDSEQEAALLVRVANTDLIRGDLAAADRLARRALDYCERALPADALVTWFARSGVAMVRLASGDGAGAYDILAAASPVFEHRLPPGHIYRIGAQIGLAYCLAARGDLPGARRCAEDAVEGSTRANGPDHALTLNTKSNLAQVLQAQGDSQGAEALQREVMAAWHRATDRADLDMLTDEFALAQSKVGSGEIAEVAPVIERAAAAFLEALGADNVLTLNAQLERVLVLAGRLDFAAARRLADDVVPRIARVYGPDNPTTLRAQVVEAQMLLIGEDYLGTLARLEPIVARLEAALGPLHADTLGAKIALAQARLGNGDLAGARAALDVVIPQTQAQCGPAHPLTINAQMCLAQVLAEQGDHARRAQAWEDIVAGWERGRGRDAPETLGAMVSLGQAYYALEQFPKAGEVMREVVARGEACLARDHPTTLLARSGLALSLASQGRTDEARGAWEQLLAAKTRVSGRQDPQTIQAAEFLFNACWLAGDGPACRGIFRDYLAWLPGRDPQTLEPFERNLRTLIVEHTDWLRAAPPSTTG